MLAHHNAGYWVFCTFTRFGKCPYTLSLQHRLSVKNHLKSIVDKSIENCDLSQTEDRASKQEGGFFFSVSDKQDHNFGSLSPSKIWNCSSPQSELHFHITELSLFKGHILEQEDSFMCPYRKLSSHSFCNNGSRLVCDCYQFRHVKDNTKSMFSIKTHSTVDLHNGSSILKYIVASGCM